MEIKIRNLSEAAIAKIDSQAKHLNISREEYLRRMILVNTMNSHESQLWYSRVELYQKILQQLDKNEVFLKSILEALEENHG